MINKQTGIVSRRRFLRFSGSHGYTLLETMISLALLMTIAVPLLSRLYRGFRLNETRLELTGTWLLEQEAAVIKTFPAMMQPVKRRYIEGQEWTLREEKKTDGPVHYLLTAEIRGKERARVYFYGRDDDAYR